MSKQYIYTMMELSKFYGDRQVLKDINLSFFPGAKIGVVGENGAGKSTLLKIMAGLDNDFSGQSRITEGFKSGIVLQEPDLDPTATIKSVLESAFSDAMAVQQQYDKVTESLATPMGDDEMEKALAKMGELQDKLDALDVYNLDKRIEVASDALCLPDDDRIIDTLSGGEKRRVALCQVLLEKPDLLLLDEPTNHLDAETVSWLEEQLREYPGTVIIVTHDRYFLDNVTKWILELEGGRGIPWEGNYTSWLEQKLARLAARDKGDVGKARAMKKELAWIKMSNANRKELSRTRLIEYEKLVSQQSARQQGDRSFIQIAPGPELGDSVIEFMDVAKGFENELFNDMNFLVPKGAVVGVIGPNGTGKTTLFKLLTGEEKPDSGAVKIGQTVLFAHVDQERSALSGKGLVDEFGGEGAEIIIGKRAVPVRQYLSWFGFTGSSQQKNVTELSGGERNRFHLAKVLKIGGNVLLLDEPTNDLDVNTLRMLEEGINEFAGNILVISHDRFFLDRICTHLLIFEGQTKARWYTGNFDDYEKWRKYELGAGTFINRRSRYRKFVKGH